MKSPWSVTLAKRLFVLMWVALVASHLAAYAAVASLRSPPNGGPPDGRLPTFPSLPPTPGVPQAEPGPPPGEDGLAPGPRRQPDGAVEPGDPADGLPTRALLLDYGIRLAVIAAAAWLGSRWLAAPMRDLAAASRTLGATIGSGDAAPTLDEARGTTEVREAAKVFNSMARQLREQFHARGLMIAAISHDLRTPLTRLRMRLEGIDAPAALRQRSVADIHEMNDLIDSVLDVFRNDGPGTGEALQATDVGALVQALVDDLAEQGQPVTFVGDTGAVTLARPAALQRVVGNVVSNALRYGKQADLRVEARADRIAIAVDDQGPGVPEDQLQAVFQPFYRVEASRNRASGGTGLGLYIARDLAERQGGRLTLANRPEGGLRAEIVLPRVLHASR